MKRVKFTRDWQQYLVGQEIEPMTGGLWDLLVNELKVAVPIETAALEPEQKRGRGRPRKETRAA